LLLRLLIWLLTPLLLLRPPLRLKALLRLLPPVAKLLLRPLLLLKLPTKVFLLNSKQLLQAE
jgi:hypothetical protein